MSSLSCNPGMSEVYTDTCVFFLWAAPHCGSAIREKADRIVVTDSQAEAQPHPVESGGEAS